MKFFLWRAVVIGAVRILLQTKNLERFDDIQTAHRDASIFKIEVNSNKNPHVNLSKPELRSNYIQEGLKICWEMRR